MGGFAEAGWQVDIGARQAQSYFQEIDGVLAWWCFIPVKTPSGTEDWLHFGPFDDQESAMERLAKVLKGAITALSDHD